MSVSDLFFEVINQQCRIQASILKQSIDKVKFIPQFKSVFIQHYGVVNLLII
jgi:hypothetical protein